jgi:hypothetical protein
MAANIKDKLKDYHNLMIQTADDLKIDDLTTKTVTVRLGNKVYDLVPSHIETIDVESQIRQEIEDKLIEKRMKIKEAIKSKMSEVSSLVSSIQDEYERKERLLKDTMSKSVPMPNVTWSHAQRGLSIVKGGNRGELYWLVKRTYNPKYIDHKNIEPLYVKKLMTNIYIRIATKDDTITSITSHYMNTLEFFEHYHQAHPDCWGNWKKPTHWKTPDDIIQAADDAIAVMENINTMSIARRNPALMPRLETLRRHVMAEVTAPKQVKVSTTGMREGLGAMAPAEDVWGN